jgi:23S rRNA pseudouridine955/2504/2580 synthase
MKKSFLVQRYQAGGGLLSFLRDYTPEAPSVKAIKRAIDGKRCRINGRIECFSTYKVKQGDRIEIDLTPIAIPATCDILYQDEQLLVVNKPSGLLSQDQRGYQLAHRLDKDTSGCLLLCKTGAIKEQLKQQFMKFEVKKQYLVRVDGTLRKDRGTVDNCLGPKSNWQGQTLYASMPSGRRAVTHWQLLRAQNGTSLLLCEPVTGRTHQIRVHFSEMGHPILGDSLYGCRPRSGVQAPRLLLHAYTLTLAHPTTGKLLTVTAPPIAELTPPQTAAASEQLDPTDECLSPTC